MALSIRPYKLYENGQATDKIGGYSYECLAPMNNYEKFVVKVPNLPPIIDNESLSEQTFVTFEGFVARFYRDRGGYYQLSCKAEKAILIGKGGK
jgi:hypothetical protein